MSSDGSRQTKIALEFCLALNEGHQMQKMKNAFILFHIILHSWAAAMVAAAAAAVTVVASNLAISRT